MSVTPAHTTKQIRVNEECPIAQVSPKTWQKVPFFFFFCGVHQSRMQNAAALPIGATCHFYFVAVLT